jgi:hypothetical protein
MANDDVRPVDIGTDAASQPYIIEPDDGLGRWIYVCYSRVFEISVENHDTRERCHEERRHVCPA